MRATNYNLIANKYCWWMKPNKVALGKERGGIPCPKKVDIPKTVYAQSVLNILAGCTATARKGVCKITKELKKKAECMQQNYERSVVKIHPPFYVLV